MIHQKLNIQCEPTPSGDWIAYHIDDREVIYYAQYGETERKARRNCYKYAVRMMRRENRYYSFLKYFLR